MGFWEEEYRGKAPVPNMIENRDTTDQIYHLDHLAARFLHWEVTLLMLPAASTTLHHSSEQRHREKPAINGCGVSSSLPRTCYLFPYIQVSAKTLNRPAEWAHACLVPDLGGGVGRWGGCFQFLTIMSNLGCNFFCTYS